MLIKGGQSVVSGWFQVGGDSVSLIRTRRMGVQLN